MTTSSSNETPKAEDHGSRRVLPVLLAALAPFAALPWTLAHWPAGDDPNHIAVAHVLSRLSEPGSPFARYFRDTMTLKPYVVQYSLTLFFGRFIGLDHADRLLVSLAILGLPMAVLFLLRKVAPERQTNVYHLIPAAAGYLLLWGFINFLLGLTIALFAVGLLWNTRRIGSLVAGSTLLLLSALTHPLAAYTAGFFLVVLEWGRLRRWVTWARFALIGAPSAALLAYGSHVAGQSPIGNHDFVLELPFFPGPGNNIWAIVVEANATLTAWELPLRALASLTLLFFAGRALFRIGLRGDSRDHALARLFAATLACLFLLPRFVPTKIYFLTDRFILLLAITAALLAPPSRWVSSWRYGRVMVLALSLSLALIQRSAARKISDRIEGVVAAGRALPRGATVLPLDFRDISYVTSVRPELHVWAYLVPERDIITPYLFADGGTSFFGGNGYRPLCYMRSFGDSFLPFVDQDTGLVWRYKDRYPFFKDGLEATLLKSAKGYERLLTLSPPDDFIELFSREWVVESKLGDTWIWRQR